MPLIYLFLLSLFLVIFIQLGILGIVLEKLGLSPNSAALLLASTLFGSMINLPLFKITSDENESINDLKGPRLLFTSMQPFTGTTIIAINVGGALIPIFFSLYLIFFHQLNPLQFIPAIMVVSYISYTFSRPIQGLGVGIPVFIAPVTAALVALIIAPAQSAPIAYVCGTLGVLIGADLFRLKDIKQMAVPVAAIGGAGTFDGIFFTGIIAVLLA
ncbi:MAG: DUF1614 domain-containing protein [Gammaproteobacteria bacterium]|nr:DUF1614 domain-containing protein [Gammaproteobacteria bacterium]